MMGADDVEGPTSDRVEVWREAVTMVLYVSIVILAALAALPAGEDAIHGDGHTPTDLDGVHGLALAGLVWGTALGLALAHWFAFRLTAHGFGRGAVSRTDVRIGLAQLAGAAVVALACTLPIVLFGDDRDVQATSAVPALIIGAAGYLASRAAGRSSARSTLTGVVVLVLGLLVVAIKNVLSGH